MGKISRTKGKVFERRWAQIVRDAFPELAHQIKRSIQSRGVEREGCDVAGFPKVWFECNHEIDPNPRKKLEQAERDRPDATFLPVAVVLRNRSRSITVFLRLEHLVQISSGFGSTLNLDEATRRMIVGVGSVDFLEILRTGQFWEHPHSFQVSRPIRRVRAR